MGSDDDPVAEQKVKEPTVIETTFRVSPDVNPNVYGNAQAVWVRLYVLKSISRFESTDIFLLKNQDEELLAKDLKLRETFNFEPAEESAKIFTLQAEETPENELFIGVVAGYRDWGNAVWRAVTPIRTEQTTALVVHLERLQVRLEIEENSDG